MAVATDSVAASRTIVAGKTFNSDRQFILYPPRQTELFGAPPHLAGSSAVLLVLFLEGIVPEKQSAGKISSWPATYIESCDPEAN